MHIQFINALLGGDFSAMDIAITHLASCVNATTSHRASICDLTFNTHRWKKHLQYCIEKHRPDVIGISTNTMYMQYVKPVIQEVKERYGLNVILGGHHASIYPQKTIEIPHTDAVCIGDGEFALAEYLDRLSQGKSMRGLAGIWAKENGSVVKNDGGRFIDDIDQFPAPDWDLWEDIDQYFYHLGSLYLIGSRGCPYKCTYCDAHGISDAVSGKYFRLRDPVKYAQEIAALWRKHRWRKHPPRLAHLFDPVFTINDDWVAKFCAEYKNQGMARDFRFSAFSRIDNLNEEKIRILSDGGCALLRVGIEAGNEYIRNEVYRKKISNAQIENHVGLCHKNGINLTAYYILGGPGESRATLKETLKLAARLKAARSAFFVYKPFTKDAIEQIRALGCQLLMDRWADADNITFDAVVKLKDMSPGQVEWFQKKAYFVTFGRRLLGMIIKQKLKYFSRLIVYMYRGLRRHLSPSYLLIYYHIYSYDNFDK
jgi:hypothetical protein